MEAAPSLSAGHDDSLWYFAYGSNLSSSVISGRRNINPLKKQILTIHGYVLCFNHPGVPYREPAFASIRRRVSVIDDDIPDVCGIAYLVSREQFSTIVATEGGGISYKVIILQGSSYAPVAVKPAGQGPNEDVSTEVYTLTAKCPANISRRPTKRYMALLVQGAMEHSFPEAYIDFLVNVHTFEPGATHRLRLGKWLFLLFWTFVQRQIQRGIGHFKNEEGNVPPWFCTIFEILVYCMWTEHDYLFAPIFGRGDGLSWGHLAMYAD